MSEELFGVDAAGTGSAVFADSSAGFFRIPEMFFVSDAFDAAGVFFSAPELRAEELFFTSGAFCAGAFSFLAEFDDDGFFFDGSCTGTTGFFSTVFRLAELFLSVEDAAVFNAGEDFFSGLEGAAANDFLSAGFKVFPDFTTGSGLRAAEALTGDAFSLPAAETDERLFPETAETVFEDAGFFCFAAGETWETSACEPEDIFFTAGCKRTDETSFPFAALPLFSKRLFFVRLADPSAETGSFFVFSVILFPAADNLAVFFGKGALETEAFFPKILFRAGTFEDFMISRTSLILEFRY